MITVSTTSRENAVARAKLWLEALSPSTREAKALRSLGLLCCKHLRSGVGLSVKGNSALVRLPAVATFVTMDRDKTLAFCLSISLASVHARRMDAKKQETWSGIFGSVALSHARMGDPATTARLLRASAQLGLKHPWLVEAERFLLDQQTPEGCFGLFARELALVGNNGTPWMAHLNLSVEVLLALSEVTALHAGQIPVNGDGADTRDRRVDFPASTESAHPVIPRGSTLSPSRTLKTSKVLTGARISRTARREIAR